jgi:hypothetical protein
MRTTMKMLTVLRAAAGGGVAAPQPATAVLVDGNASGGIADSLTPTVTWTPSADDLTPGDGAYTYSVSVTLNGTPVALDNASGIGGDVASYTVDPTTGTVLALSDTPYAVTVTVTRVSDSATATSEATTAHVDARSISGFVALFDFEDAGTLFQDSAGTTPVTANDNPIGRINSKYDGSIFLSAADAARPLWKSADGRYGFFQTDDVLSTSAAALMIDGNAPVTVVIRASTESNGALVSWGNSGHPNPARVLSKTTTNFRYTKRNLTGTTVTPEYARATSSDLATFSTLDSGTLLNVWQDGIQQLNNADVDVGGIVFDLFGIGAQVRTSPANFITSKVKKCLVFSGLLSTDARLAVEAYAAF